LAVFPSTYSPTQPMYFETADLGASWNLLPASSIPVFRAGLEASTKFFEVPGGLNQQYETLGAGLSFGYRQLTVYAMARAIFTSGSPIKEYWTEDIRPWPDQLRVGTQIALEKGAQIGAEVNASLYEQGGKLSYRFGAVPAQVHLVYRHTSKIFGGHELGGGVAVELDRGRGGKIKASAEQEFGGASLGQSQNMTASGLNFQAVTCYLYGIGKISVTDMVQRLNPSFHVTGTETITVDGRPQLVVAYTQNGMAQTFTPSTKSAALEYARTSLSAPDYQFMENLMSSGSLENFAERYARTSTDEKVMIASRLALLANRGYNNVLENASPFSSDKKELAGLTPNVEFAALQRSILQHQKQNEGICGNINGMAAEFLRLSGVEAYTIVVGSSAGAHAIAVARDEHGNASYAISYGNVYKTPGSGMWPAVQAYSKAEGIVLIGAFVYGKGNAFLGYYKGPEGRLLDTALQTNEDALRDSLTREK
jgi:hypothetical protein